MYDAVTVLVCCADVVSTGTVDGETDAVACAVEPLFGTIVDVFGLISLDDTAGEDDCIGDVVEVARGSVGSIVAPVVVCFTDVSTEVTGAVVLEVDVEIASVTVVSLADELVAAPLVGVCTGLVDFSVPIVDPDELEMDVVVGTDD